MLRRLEKMVGFTVEGTSGEVGKVHDYYFDDHEWVLRYIVVETGSWLASKLALISLAFVGSPDWQAARIPVELSQKQVADSPTIDLNKPVSQQPLVALHDAMAGPPIGERAAWATGYLPLTIAPRTVEERSASAAETRQKKEAKGDPYLRSISEVSGYHIQASDGDIGHVVDFFAGEPTWRIEYMLVDTRNLLPGRHVLISPRWIRVVSWPERKVHVNVTREKVKDSPRFDPLPDTLSRDNERTLHAHYQLPSRSYWSERTSADKRIC